MNLKTDPMQKAQSAVTSKRIIFIFISLHSFSQKKEIIKNSDDYNILNKTIDRFFYFKHERDSIELVDLMLIEKKVPNNIEIQKSIKEAKEEIKNDTIYIKAIADKIMYKTFFSKKARWKIEKKRYKKVAEDLEVIFSLNEMEYYQEQVEDNIYLWRAKKINSKGRVFIEQKYNYTREEAIIRGIIERDKLGRVLIQRTNHYFTFSKPIYSKNRNIALIAYNFNANYILYIFERINNEWVFKLVLSESYLI